MESEHTMGRWPDRFPEQRLKGLWEHNLGAYKPEEEMYVAQWYNLSWACTRPLAQSPAPLEKEGRARGRSNFVLDFILEKQKTMFGWVLWHTAV